MPELLQLSCPFRGESRFEQIEERFDTVEVLDIACGFWSFVGAQGESGQRGNAKDDMSEQIRYDCLPSLRSNRGREIGRRGEVGAKASEEVGTSCRRGRDRIGEEDIVGRSGDDRGSCCLASSGFALILIE